MEPWKMNIKCCHLEADKMDELDLRTEIVLGYCGLEGHARLSQITL